MDYDVSDEYYVDGEDSAEQKECWKNIVLDIKKYPKKKFSEITEVPFFDISNFVPIKKSYDAYLSAYSELNYYAYRYANYNGYHPYVYRFDQFNIDKFVADLFKYHKVPTEAYIKVSYQSSDDPRVSNILITFTPSILMFIDGEDRGIIFYNPKEENDENSFLYTLLGLLRTSKRPKVSKNKIYIVYRSQHGFDKIGFDVKKIKINLTKNYNNGFDEFSEKIITGLNSKNKTNLVILSGEPGTGKTTYIRYLTSKLKKNIIFISPDMAESITDPAFIPFLMKNNDSVLIIEDAEPALEKRNQGGRSSAVSNVLNLTDGLLSDCLKISIVATFNTGTKNIDEALMRKGRLLMNYKFDKLDIEKSKELLESLGYKDVEVKEPMTLAEIYFYGTDNNTQTLHTKKLGF